MEGADIYQIAKNCRTSVEMIEKHYAIHLKKHVGCVRDQRPKTETQSQKEGAGDDQSRRLS
jgi:hypothetical protein